MLNTLLFIHLVIAILLVIVILLQKTSTDGLSGIGGGGNTMGLVSSRSAANFFTKTTVVLGVIFFANAIILGNLSSKSVKSVVDRIEDNPMADTMRDKNTEEHTLPVAK